MNFVGYKGRKDRPRIIGTYTERVLLHRMAHEVFVRLPDLHPDLDVDFDSLEHIPLGFLREPAGSLFGFCSFSSNKQGQYATLHRDRNRTHRILVSRELMHQDPLEALKTIHHEFVHAMLGEEVWKAEKHGSMFTEHDSRWSESIGAEVIREVISH